MKDLWYAKFVGKQTYYILKDLELTGDELYRTTKYLTQYLVKYGVTIEGIKLPIAVTEAEADDVAKIAKNCIATATPDLISDDLIEVQEVMEVGYDFVDKMRAYFRGEEIVITTRLKRDMVAGETKEEPRKRK